MSVLSLLWLWLLLFAIAIATIIDIPWLFLLLVLLIQVVIEIIATATASGFLLILLLFLLPLILILLLLLLSLLVQLLLIFIFLQLTLTITITATIVVSMLLLLLWSWSWSLLLSLSLLFLLLLHTIVGLVKRSVVRIKLSTRVTHSTVITTQLFAHTTRKNEVDILLAILWNGGGTEVIGCPTYRRTMTTLTSGFHSNTHTTPHHTNPLQTKVKLVFHYQRWFSNWTLYLLILLLPLCY